MFIEGLEVFMISKKWVIDFLKTKDKSYIDDLLVSVKWNGTNKITGIHLKCKYNKKGGTYYMQYDLKKS